MNENTPEKDKPQPIAMNENGITFSSIEDLYRWGNAVVRSGLAPKGLDSPEKVIVATQYGLELGLSPMTALSHIAVINGKPTLYGDAALGLVKKSGLLEDFEEVIEKSGSEITAVCRSKRFNQKTPVTSRFSVEDARRAGLWGKTGPWKTHPERMLKYKARAFNLRDNFPDVLCGIHLFEEMQGEEMMTKQAENVTVSDSLNKAMNLLGQTDNVETPAEAGEPVEAE